MRYFLVTNSSVADFFHFRLPIADLVIAERKSESEIKNQKSKI